MKKTKNKVVATEKVPCLIRRCLQLYNVLSTTKYFNRNQVFAQFDLMKLKLPTISSDKYYIFKKLMQLCKICREIIAIQVVKSALPPMWFKNLPIQRSKPVYLKIQGVLCFRCFLRLWKNNRVSRKPSKRRSDLVHRGLKLEVLYVQY